MLTGRLLARIGCYWLILGAALAVGPAGAQHQPSLTVAADHTPLPDPARAPGVIDKYATIRLAKHPRFRPLLRCIAGQDKRALLIREGLRPTPQAFEAWAAVFVIPLEFGGDPTLANDRDEHLQNCYLIPSARLADYQATIPVAQALIRSKAWTLSAVQQQYRADWTIPAFRQAIK